jgi:serine phosphatase RsbU (regulator of sigma subunit)
MISRIPFVFILIMVLLLPEKAEADGVLIDSLQKAYDGAKTEKLKRQTQWQLAKAYMFVDPKKAIEISKDAYIYFESKKDTATCLNILNTLGVANAVMGKYDFSEKYFLKKLNLGRKYGDSSNVAGSLSSLGNVYHSISQYKKSIKSYKAALHIFESLKNDAGIANVLGNIGNAYKAEGNYQEALNSYFKALKINEKLGVSNGPVLSNIGNIFADMDNRKKAKIYFKKSIDVFKAEKNDYYVAWGYDNLASVYFDEGNIEVAIDYYKKAEVIHREQEDLEGIGNVFHAYGNIYYAKKELDEAVKNYDSAARYFKEIELNYEYAKVYIDRGMLEWQRENKAEAAKLFEKAYAEKEYFAYDFELAELYKVMAMAADWNGNFKQAFEFQKMHGDVRDSLFKTELTREIAEKEAKYQNEKKQKEIQKLKDQKKLDDLKSEKDRQRSNDMLNFAFVGGFLLLITVIVLIRSNRMKQKNNHLLHTQNTEIIHQKEIIEEKNKDITDSINYAKSIQQAILPDNATVKSCVGDSFILFMPRDIVSGDFYWMHKNENGDLYFAVADCTGHGVPGAFMSMMGNDMLNKIIIDHGISEPGKILSELNNEVKKALAKNSSADTMRDGMDIALCKMNGSRTHLTYATAMRSVYKFGKNVLDECKGDKNPIGGNTEFNFEFGTHVISLEKGDALYLSTDGFADQFGGSDGKKFMTKNMKELIISVNGNSMEQQYTVFKNAFLGWKGSYEQVDDVTVFGVRV